MAIEKLNMETKDLSQEHIKQIQQLFPNAVTEINKDGKITLGIDFDVLKQELSNELIDKKQERYQMTWPGKKKAMLLANSKINASLRPLKEKSVDFDNTKNIYIEGDNLDVLKLLRETYLNKVKMIYIDPPYNTGNDFVYNDDFAQSTDEYNTISGQYDEQGNRMVLNNESNGRFHTDWLNMMYCRLKVSRDLLTDDGAIFVSIDDNEQSNLLKLLTEIFGEDNKVAEFIVIRSEGGGLAKQVIKGHDYLFVFAKDISKFSPLGRPKDIRGKIIEKDGEKYWIQEDWLRKEFGKYGNCHYEEIVQYKGKEKFDEINDGLKNGKYVLVPKSNGMNIVGKLRNIKDDSSKFYSILKHLSANGIKDLKDLTMEKFFSYPKPVSLLKEIISGITFFTLKKQDIILDFFSGSATTAHAVMELNAEDKGNRKFIMVQMPEECKDETEAQKMGYKTICDIGEERIRRAGKKIKDELIEKKNNAGMLNDDVIDPDSLDIGFRVFKFDSSNMNDVYYNPNQTQKNLLDTTIDNIKLDRTGLDLLFQVMLELGVELSAKIDEKDILGKKCYFVNDNDIAACFDDDLTNELLTELAKTKPLYAVFKDSCFNNDSVAINNEQIFKTYSPSTKVKVL